MNSKTLIQIILATVILIILFLIYDRYFDREGNEILKKEKEVTTNETKKKDLSGNIIKDIVYKSRDENDNVYTIKSEYGEFDNTDNDIILMTKVSAIIRLNDGSVMTLQSQNAKYNIINYDTNFFNNVKMNYLDHKLNADNIDVFFKDSKLEAYNNLVYRNLDLNLIADKVEINLIEKSSKIFMFNNDKIKVIKK